MSMIEKVNELKTKREELLLGGGQEKINKQKDLSKDTAYERISNLFDEDSFVQTDAFTQSRSTDFGMDKKRIPGDGVICGYGTINGRPVYAAVQDYTVLHGSIGEMQAKKIVRTIDNAMKMGAPMLYLYDTDGLRLEEGVDVLSATGELLAKQVSASGVIPQISAIMGNCAGLSALSAVYSDFVLMVDKTSHMYMSGPVVIESVTGKAPKKDTYASSEVQTSLSGNAHISFLNDKDCISGIKALLSYLPDNNLSVSLRFDSKDLPNRTNKSLYDLDIDNYDMRSVITEVVDELSFMEIQPAFGSSVITGFARLNGMAVALVANNPLVNDGNFDIDSSDKAARFTSFADAFNIPLVTFTHSIGYTVDLEEEKKGLVRHLSKVLFAFSQASVPKINIITGKAIGGGFVLMNSKASGADLVYAYPSAVISIMEPTKAANIIYSEEISNSDNPASFRSEKETEYGDKHANAYEAAKRGYVDDVIDPAYTRSYLINALEMLSSKKVSEVYKKHGNMPL